MPVVVTSSRKPASADPLKRFVTHAPVNPFPEAFAKEILRISRGIAARMPLRPFGRDRPERAADQERLELTTCQLSRERQSADCPVRGL